MLTDRQLRLRADIVRDQLDQTMKVSRRAIRASAEIIDDVRRTRDTIKGHVDQSVKHLHASRRTLASRNPK